MADAINLVIVGSAFSSPADYDAAVADILVAFDAYPPTQPAHAALNVWKVPHASEDADLGCYYDCQGIPQLLCCDPGRVHGVADAACGSRDASGGERVVIVVHDDDTYGGAGYTDFCTVSTNWASPMLAVHEIAHAAFSLVDEYTYGWGRDDAPNCDAAGCPKWADLLAVGYTGEPGHGCFPGKCQNGQYSASGGTIMDEIHLTFGVVNERFTCCVYLWTPAVQADLGALPAYCGRFVDGNFGARLVDYCASVAAFFPDDIQPGGRASAVPRGVAAGGVRWVVALERRG
jgi:hypothetical protein